jgi:hypothetical protein
MIQKALHKHWTTWTTQNTGVNTRVVHFTWHFPYRPWHQPETPYQARQRSWSVDTSNDMQKMSCHNLFITYFTLTFFKHSLLYCSKDLWTDKLRKINSYLAFVKLVNILHGHMVHKDMQNIVFQSNQHISKYWNIRSLNNLKRNN